MKPGAPSLPLPRPGRATLRRGLTDTSRDCDEVLPRLPRGCLDVRPPLVVHFSAVEVAGVWFPEGEPSPLACGATGILSWTASRATFDGSPRACSKCRLALAAEPVVSAVAGEVRS